MAFHSVDSGKPSISERHGFFSVPMLDKKLLKSIEVFPKEDFIRYSLEDLLGRKKSVVWLGRRKLQTTFHGYGHDRHSPLLH